MKADEFDKINKIIDYNPETGEFVWKNSRPGARKGDLAGRLNNEGYWRIVINYKPYNAHYLAFLLMKGRWPLKEIDHIDGYPSNNKWHNLREVGHDENMRNLKRAKNNISGVTGVFWCNRDNLWKSQIQIKGKNKHLGSFKNFNDAVAARKKANEEYGFHSNHGKR